MNFNYFQCTNYYNNSQIHCDVTAYVGLYDHVSDVTSCEDNHVCLMNAHKVGILHR